MQAIKIIKFWQVMYFVSESQFKLQISTLLHVLEFNDLFGMACIVPIYEL